PASGSISPAIPATNTGTVHDEVGRIIVADVSAEGVKALLAPDRARLDALIERRYRANVADSGGAD
ncbi:MAG TPA: hypothetical protein VF958_05475, partial [Thermoanaerobaculia bacterium]